MRESTKTWLITIAVGVIFVVIVFQIVRAIFDSMPVTCGGWGCHNVPYTPPSLEWYIIMIGFPLVLIGAAIIGHKIQERVDK